MSKPVKNRASIKVSEYVDIFYREFWNNQNRDKNTFLPHEQLLTVNRHIIWAAYKLGIRKGEERKTTQLSGETSKYHIAGDSTIQDSVKGMATDHRRQVACRVFHGIGNFGSPSGDLGAAARYLSVQGTPLLAAILKDVPYTPKVVDETGEVLPKWVSMPYPMMLVNGTAQIGLGKAAYFCERDVHDVMSWIEDNLVKGEKTNIPNPISSTGCKVWTNPKNGYVVYEAVIEREGKYDVITALPPKVSEYNLMLTLNKKLPKSVSSKILDASGEGAPIRIQVPKGYITPENLSIYKLQNARKEAHYIWDEELNTMRMSSFEEVASIWFEGRKEIVKTRLETSIAQSNKEIHRINLIAEHEEKNMNGWEEEKIVDHFGQDDANIIFNSTKRAFLPGSLRKGQELKEKLMKEIRKINKDIKNIGEFVIKEARDIIEEQEKFYKDKE